MAHGMNIYELFDMIDPWFEFKIDIGLTFKIGYLVLLLFGSLWHERVHFALFYWLPKLVFGLLRDRRKLSFWHLSILRLVTEYFRESIRLKYVWRIVFIIFLAVLWLRPLLSSVACMSSLIPLVLLLFDWPCIIRKLHLFLWVIVIPTFPLFQPFVVISWKQIPLSIFLLIQNFIVIWRTHHCLLSL